MKRVISAILSVIMMLLPMSSLGATGHINGCTNTDFNANCCTKTFVIIAKSGYEVVDVLVNGESKGAITSYTFTNITGPQNLKVITEPIGGTTPGGGTGGDTGGGTETGIKVKFNSNGGLGNMPSQTFEEGATQYLNPCTYTKDGFDFAGWSTTASGEVEYEDECPFSATETITLYAVWVPSISTLPVGSYISYAVPSSKSYSGKWVLFKNNNGQLDIISKEPTEDITITGASDARSIVKKLNNMSSAYVNSVYATHARSIGSTYPWNETTVTSGVSVGTVGATDSSNWPYKDTLYQADVDIINSCIVNGSEYPLRHSSGDVWLASRAGLYVDTDGSHSYGWLLHSNGTVENAMLYNTWNTSSNDSGKLRPVISLRANLWVTGGKGTSSDPYTLGVKPVKTYRVTFDSNGGMGTMSTQTFTEGETKNLTANTFTNLGKNFLGWATSSTGSVQLTDGQSYTATGHITLYAVWAGQCTIKFNPNGGSGTMADQIFSEGVPQALPANTFTRTGFSFAGWATTASGTAEYTDGDNYTAQGDQTLYATWQADLLFTIQSGVTVKYANKTLTTGQNFVPLGSSVTVTGTREYVYIYFNGSLVREASPTLGNTWSATASYTFVASSDTTITVSYRTDTVNGNGPWDQIIIRIVTE